MTDTLLQLGGYGLAWLAAAFVLALWLAPMIGEAWDEEDYDPEFAHFVEPITQAAKQERLAQSQLYPKTNFDVEYVVPLSARWTVQDMRQRGQRG